MTTDIKSGEFSISSTLLEKLKKEGTTKTFEPDTVLIDENDYIRFVPIVLNGSLKVFKLDEDGREMLLYYIKPGESCVMSFLGATCNGTSKIKAVVEEEAEVLMLPVNKATDLIRENPRGVFVYARYDRTIGEPEMEAALKVSKKGFTLDNIELMDFLGEMGRRYAEQSVKLEHFE